MRPTQYNYRLSYHGILRTCSGDNCDLLSGADDNRRICKVPVSQRLLLRVAQN
jgi:hypothetical protein